MSQPILKLFPIKGVNFYQLPEPLRELFPNHSSNDEDCIPVDEQDLTVRQDHNIKPRCTRSDSPNVTSLF